MTTLCVVMPAWNEAEGICDFLSELGDSLKDWTPTFIVVNDCSTDNTTERLHQLADTGFPVRVLSNTQNLGHGPTTVLALESGLMQGSDVVVAIDGDGQFRGDDVRRVVESLERSSASVVEGVRVDRMDPYYRRVVTQSTRILVASRCGIRPRDANTPLRAYRRSELERLLRSIPNSCPIPNLVISTLTRSLRLEVLEIPVRSLPRRGADPNGTTWGNRTKNVPSARFVRFCLMATGAWVRMSRTTSEQLGAQP